MDKPLKILLLGHDTQDSESIQEQLAKSELAFEIRRVDTITEFFHKIENSIPDVILFDNLFSQLNATETLLHVRNRYQYVPFILITDSSSVEFAATLIKQGADDYVLKDRLIRLPAAIKSTIRQRQTQKEILDYKNALDQTSIVSVTDQKGIIIYVNDNFCKISKYSREELIGQDHRIVNSDYHPSPYMRNLWTTIASGKIWKGEFRNKAKDGSIYWVVGTVVPFLNEKNKPYQYLSIRNDITERKIIEENLLQTQLRFRHAQGIAHLGNWEFNFITNRSHWSDEAYRIYGLIPGNHNLSMDEWMSYTHPEDFERVKELFDRSGATLSSVAVHHRIIRKDGTVRHLYRQSKYELDATGKAIGLYGVILDITEIKEAEQELRTAHERLMFHIENSPLGYIEWGDVARPKSWSKRAEEIFGWSEREVTSIHYDWSNNIHEDDRSWVNKISEDLVSGKIERNSLQHRSYTKDGRVIWCEWFNSVLKNKDGKVITIMSLVRDITEKIKAEEDLRSMEKEVSNQKIQQQKKITRAIITAQENERNRIGRELHDNVNQILAATKMYLCMVGGENETLNGLIKYPMELIDRSISEIRALTHKQVTPLKDVNLQELVQSQLELLKNSAGINTKFVCNVNGCIIDDDLKLNTYRIIQEQINNVLKYAEAKNFGVNIHTNNNKFHVLIEDDGNGFDLNKKRNGIGISNIINRVESFNGSFDIDSAPGSGCRMHIVVPLDLVSQN